MPDWPKMLAHPFSPMSESLTCSHGPRMSARSECQHACKGTGWPSVLPLRFLYASCHVVNHGQSSSTVFVQAVLRPPVYVGLGPTSCLEALLPPRFPTSCASLHLPLSGASPPGVTPGQWRVRPLAEGALRPGKAGAAQRARHSAPVDASLQAAVLVHLSFVCVQCECVLSFVGSMQRTPCTACAKDCAGTRNGERSFDASRRYPARVAANPSGHPQRHQAAATKTSTTRRTGKTNWAAAACDCRVRSVRRAR